MWVSMKEMPAISRPGTRAVGAFHAVNLEQTQGVLEAAVETRSPVILVLSEPEAMYAGIGAFLAMARELAAEVPLPVAVQLERVRGREFIRHALEKGVTGLMVDARNDQRGFGDLMTIKEMCGQAGALFETEIALQDNSPLLAAFAGKLLTSVRPDSVCLSVSAEERDKPGESVFELLREIRESMDVPVSLAGAGAWPDEDIQRAVRLGAWKMSVGTRTNQAFTAGLREFLDKNPDRVHPSSYMASARDSFRKTVAGLIRSFKAEDGQ